MNKNVKIIPATGKEGKLIIKNNNYYFRVYFDNFKFKDYQLKHHDLVIRIQDHDANFYEYENNLILDSKKAIKKIQN